MFVVQSETSRCFYSGAYRREEGYTKKSPIILKPYGIKQGTTLINVESSSCLRNQCFGKQMQFEVQQNVRAHEIRSIFKYFFIFPPRHCCIANYHGFRVQYNMIKQQVCCCSVDCAMAYASLDLENSITLNECSVLFCCVWFCRRSISIALFVSHTHTQSHLNGCTFYTQQIPLEQFIHTHTHIHMCQHGAYYLKFIALKCIVLLINEHTDNKLCISFDFT